MRKIARLLVLILILGGFVSNGRAQDKEHMFDGFWRANGGSIIRIDGSQGVLVYTPVESWKEHINKVIIRNIRQIDNKWVADEFIGSNGKEIWGEVEWGLNQNRIIRRVMFKEKLRESYYERTRLRKPNMFQFGLMYYYFDYEEDLSFPLKSTEEGWLPSVYLAYTYNMKNDPYTKVFVEYTRADTDYDGSLDDGTPWTDTTDNIFFRFEWDIGYTFDGGDKYSVTPYVGWGSRYWKRGLGGPRPFDEKYSWQYIPVGVRAEFELHDKWDVGANVAVRFMFGGKMRAESSAFNFKVDLGNKVGWFAEMPIRYLFSTVWSFVAAPWYEYSEIGESNQVLIIDSGSTIRGPYLEPDSTTYQYGVNVGLVYSF
ncbi:MAG: hypothetical protein JSV60_00955 [Desulfobacterales bacterium]|nr:MAG: hypothetical protein JSV60_00955 [Desulfobacterales bacterium]